MKQLVGVLARVAFVALVATSPVHASIIPYDNGNDGYFLLEGSLGNPDAEEAFVEALFGGDLTYLNKYDYDEGFEGGGAVNLGADFFVQGAAGESNSKDISWNLTGTGYGANYVLIKDGTVDGFHLYRLYEVTPDQFLVGEGTVSFGPRYPDKAISHVTWLGSTHDEFEQVPDGGATLGLLGLAMLGVGYLRKRMA